ncbi:hypothetical protein ANCDUO_24063 [Ancylostoma duodenale]|uniref:Uncharacterized protein n=1 Tax=Ancylostoma duodenale TaxID=51022 RepID=A0A0C2C899_9BILA|nr:hypothetical protein ANCDUO_24063 [Ancylostoma duodenale]
MNELLITQAATRSLILCGSPHSTYARSNAIRTPSTASRTKISSNSAKRCPRNVRNYFKRRRSNKWDNIT